MKSGIYQITNTKSQRIYIGSSLNVKTRMQAHRTALRRGTHRSYLLQRAFDKYGEECFSFRQIVICHEHDRLEYEQAIIDGLKPFYNICKQVGSTKGLNISPEGRANMSAAWKKRGMSELQAKHVAEMTESNRGRKKPPMSDGQKAKIAASLCGRPSDPEANKKRSASQSGVQKSAEHKKKIAEAHKGKKRPPFSAEWRDKLGAVRRGKTHTEESKQRMSEAMKKVHARKKENII